VAFSASGSDRQILPVPRLFEAGSLAMSEMSPSKQRPRVLIDAFKAGRIPRADMPELIQFAWTYDDSPTSDVGEAAWIDLFEHVGFFTYLPVQVVRPASPVTLYRGTTADRLLRMSWASERDVAAKLAGVTPGTELPGCLGQPYAPWPCLPICIGLMRAGR
jgi:hypothetical protein